MNIGIVGLGLIGGSLAKAVKKNSSNHVLGYDIRPEIVSDSLADGVLDGVLESHNLKDCGIVIVALFPGQTVRYITEHAADFSKKSIILDVSGVKQAVCDGLKETVRQYGLTFVGAHPMAGKEKFGYYYSDSDLFKGASLILTPYEDTSESVIQTITEFSKQVGFAKEVVTTPVLHDIVIAYTSQLPHIISNAYVKSPNLKNEAGFSAGSFQDLSRVARLNEEMWTELFLSNREPLQKELDILIENLNAYRSALAGRDEKRLKELLREGRILKEGHQEEK